jgi:hypothetical protein
MDIDFNESSPDKILKQEFLDEYNSAVESIWWQLISFSSKMIVVEKVNSFRFDLFDDNYPDNLFWHLVISSFYESSILCIWRVLIDNSNEGITLKQLKNKISKNILDKEIRTELKKKLKYLDFDKSLKKINDKIEIIRHNSVAHLNFQDYGLNPSENKLPALELDELKLANLQIVKYFNFLCFDSQKSVYTIDYHPEIKHPVGIDSRIDVERILDLIAKESYFIKGEEEIKDILQMKINQLPDDDLSEINRYRIKFGYSVLRKTA